MRYVFKGCIHLIGISLLLLLSERISAEYSIPRGVFGNGGTCIASNDNKIFGTLGQPLVGVTSGASYIHMAGFWAIQSRLTASVHDGSKNKLPIEFRLAQNYPNPFMSSTVIEFALPEKCYVSISIYNVLGEEVASILEGIKPPDFYRVELTPVNLAGGIYFYRIVARSEKSGQVFSDVKKMLYLH